MKANAPEKIYVQLPSRNWISRTWNETPIKEGDNPNWKNATNIEYTRTDAFIEKTKKWFEQQPEIYDANGVRHYVMEDFEDLVNYIKESKIKL